MLVMWWEWIIINGWQDQVIRYYLMEKREEDKGKGKETIYWTTSPNEE